MEKLHSYSLLSLTNLKNPQIQRYTIIFEIDEILDNGNNVPMPSIHVNTVDYKSVIPTSKLYNDETRNYIIKYTVEI